ncbi:MAG: sigma-70 family RNA polymerase sigma factor [Planctomycetales bacterium]
MITDPAALVQAHQPGVWRYLRFLGCDPSEADDLAQETFLAVLKQPFEDRGREATAAYLRTAARRLFLKSIRDANRSPVIQNLDLADSVWAQFDRDDGGNAFVDALRDCVDELDGRARDVIDRRYRENQSRTDIAQSLDMTQDGVKTLLRRTRDALRRCVERKTKP